MRNLWINLLLKHFSLNHGKIIISMRRTYPYFKRKIMLQHYEFLYVSVEKVAVGEKLNPFGFTGYF